MISPLPLVFPSVYLHIVTKYIRITEISIKIYFSWLLLLLCSEATHLRSLEGCQGCRETDGATARCRRHLESQASNNFCSLKSQICIHPCSNIHRLCSATIELMQNMTNTGTMLRVLFDVLFQNVLPRRSPSRTTVGSRPTPSSTTPTSSSSSSSASSNSSSNPDAEKEKMKSAKFEHLLRQELLAKIEN